MPNLNRVMLMGNLTRDPELRYTPSNTAVANIGLAINRRWKDQQGQQQEETTFVDCEAWGRTAEVLNQYLKKGRPVYLEGRLRLDQWQDKEGQNRSKLKVVVETFQFIDSKQGAGGGDDEYSGGGGGGGYSPRPQQSRGPAPRQGASASRQNSAPPPDTHEPVGEEDIPF
jgi:single-strand DNA-binding protein